VPSSTELAAVSKPEATQEIRVQSSDFQSYRTKLAGTVDSVPAMEEEDGKKSSGGKITKAAEDKSAPAPEVPKDVVKLSKGVSPDTKALQDKVTGLQEEATAKQKAIQEANDRATALEKQVADMQKLLVMKNQAMADAQKNAAATLPASPMVVAANKPEASLLPVKEQQIPVAEEAPKVAANADNVKPVTAPSQFAEKKPEAVKITPSPVEETGFFDDINLPIVGGAGGLLAALIGGWLFLRNKRRRSLDGFEKDILTSGGLKANTVFGNTLGGTVDSGDTSFLTDFSPGTGMIDTHDVDPIAEAEVYMAYGRDSQAEEILKDAIVKEPKRYELHLKLLEMYAARKDSSAFETVAGELYSTLGTTDPTWAKVSALGRSFEPDNPLYEIAELSGSNPPVVNSEVIAETIDSEQLYELATESTLDFSVDPPETAFDASSEASEDNVLDFDIGGISSEANTIAESHASTMEIEAAKTEEKLDASIFDLGISDEPAKSAESNDLDFQLDLPEEVQTDTLQLDVSSLTSPVPVDEISDSVEEQTLDFDQTMVLGVPDSVEAEENKTAADLSSNEFSFDLPEIEVNQTKHFDEPLITKSNDTLTLDISDNLGFPEIAEKPAEETIAELPVPDFEKTSIISTDASEIDFSSTDQDFDLDLDVDFDNLETEEIAISETGLPDDSATPEIDLSGISLDLDPTPEISESVSSSESSEVDTKLDLVTAYMDMGDNEGARELLDEVLKEGGVQQRLKAQEILKSLS
jgi:pilus assembly protein FimV